MGRFLLEATSHATGCPVFYPEESDAMLLGTAVLAAAAAQLYPSLTDAMVQEESTGCSAKGRGGVLTDLLRCVQRAMNHRHKKAVKPHPEVGRSPICSGCLNLTCPITCCRAGTRGACTQDPCAAPAARHAAGRASKHAS